MTIMPFGKYSGWNIEAVPDSYCLWMVRNVDMSRWPGLGHAVRQKLVNSGYDDGYIEAILDGREESYFDDRPVAIQQERITKQVLGELRKKYALLYHPDRGGNVEAMKAVNALLDELVRML